jgi:hypothetical protein
LVICFKIVICSLNLLSQLYYNFHILAFSDDGCVILKTIVETTLMKMTRPVPDAIDNVQNPNSDVATTNVFRADGNVIMTMV